MRLKINAYNILIKLIGIFGIGVLLYDLINKVFPMNKFIGLIIFGIIIYKYLKRLSKEKINVAIFAVSMVLVFVSLVQAEELGFAFTESIYWLNTILMVRLLTDEKENSKFCDAILKSEKYLEVICIIGNIILAICLTLPVCYNDNWGGRFFVCFASSNHVLSCGCCLLLAMALFVTKSIKSNMISIAFMITPTYAVLQSGARIYLLSIMAIWFIFYRYCLKNKTLKMIILPMVGIAALYVFLNSGIYAKMITPSAYGDLVGLAKITNGRSDFWTIDIEQYINGDLFKVLLGGGFDYTSRLNMKYYNMYIWAHNDYLENLLAVGVVGVIIYLSAIKKIWIKLRKEHNFIMTCAVFFYCVVIGFMNGFFPYQHYVYSFIIIFSFVVMQKGVYEGNGKRSC